MAGHKALSELSHSLPLLSPPPSLSLYFSLAVNQSNFTTCQEVSKVISKSGEYLIIVLYFNLNSMVSSSLLSHWARNLISGMPTLAKKSFAAVHHWIQILCHIFVPVCTGEKNIFSEMSKLHCQSKNGELRLCFDHLVPHVHPFNKKKSKKRRWWWWFLVSEEGGYYDFFLYNIYKKRKTQESELGSVTVLPGAISQNERGAEVLFKSSTTDTKVKVQVLDKKLPNAIHFQGFSLASLNLHAKRVNLRAEVKWPQATSSPEGRAL